ncbi:hypothetical protein ABDK36_00170 [Staphylococcus arlettae]|nr:MULTISPECIES: hypothetical protein [Staphylococcus]
MLLASDVGYANKSWQQNILPGVLVNKKDAQESLNWVKFIAQDENCVEAIANHDTNTEPHTIVL